MTIGFIGAGNMGSAIIGGAIKSKLIFESEIYISDTNKKSLEKIADEYGVMTGENNSAAAKADILFLCVKPNVLYSVIDEIKNVISDNTIVVSIAAGQSMNKITEAFGKKVKLVRVMPNTPALVGEGMAAVSKSDSVTDDEVLKILEIFNGCGKAELVDEWLMDAVTAVSGSSPAYVFMFIEAMADAAVKGGMPRNKAYTFAAQSVLGSAKMVLETGKHPAELKDMVCSPGGTTIEAVEVLESEGLRNAVMKAMSACIEKSKKM